MVVGWLAVEADAEAAVGKKGGCWLAIAVEADAEAAVGKKGGCWMAGCRG